jgi:glycosyltransferase involved in cell wall biosynthesis
VIPDGIELDNFIQRSVPTHLRETLSIPESVPLVGFVARLVPWKGPDVFIRMAAEVAREQPDVRFLICGGELPGYQGYSDWLRLLAAELGLADRVYFLGWANPDDMPEVMASLDILVHASVRPEPFGLVIVEALACSKPVVASRAGGVSEIVEDGVSGVLVTPGDWKAMGKAVVSLVHDPSRARSIGLAGRERVSRLFGIGSHIDAIESLYDSL